MISSSDALTRLKEGNKKYLSSAAPDADISAKKREYTAQNGQAPYATVITCSDSRVIPEAIFSAGIGELFVIRTAGNTVGNTELASIEYAVSHLKTPLVLVLAHTGCGAVGAALNKEGHGFIKQITDVIETALNGETDPEKACIKNALHSAGVIKEKLGIDAMCALYKIDTGKVEFL